MPITLEDLQRIQSDNTAIDTVVTPARPATPANFTATGTELAIRLQWSQVLDADGYRIAVLDDEDLNSPIEIRELPSRDRLEDVYYAGNIAVERFFAIQSYKNLASGGKFLSDFTTPISATTVKIALEVDTAITSSNFQGTSQNYTDTETTILSAAITSTGRATFIIAGCDISTASAAKATQLRLKDGTTVLRTRRVVRNTSTTARGDASISVITTLSAGAHTINFTAQNDTDTATLNADEIWLDILEIPFAAAGELVVTESTTPTAPPSAPPTPTESDEPADPLGLPRDPLAGSDPSL